MDFVFLNKRKKMDDEILVSIQSILQVNLKFLLLGNNSKWIGNDNITQLQSSTLSVGNICQDCQYLPETTDSIAFYIYYAFPIHTYL